MINISDLVGKPFLNGGRGPDNYDCYGLVREIYRRQGIELPLIFVDCYNIEQVNGEYQLHQNHLIHVKPILYAIMTIKFNSPIVNHFGVYLGEHTFIHAREKTLSCIESIDSPQWKRNIVGYYQWRG